MLRVLIGVSALAMLAACSGPLVSFDRLVDVDIDENAQSAPAALPTEAEVAREGFFGTFAAAGEATNEAVVVAPKRGGLLGLFSKKSDTDTAVQAALSDTGTEGDVPAESDLLAEIAVEANPIKLVALAPEDNPVAEAPKRRGLLGLIRSSSADTLEGTASEKSSLLPRSTGPDAIDVAVGTTLAFGQVARVCDAKGKALGKRVEKGPARGFALYDTAPGTIAARTFYITGFNDGCARQITAATVIMSGASSYEQFHFGPTGAHLPKGATDKAYAKIKRQVCGAAKNKPCGSQIKKMDRSTFFISSYRDMGHTGSWSELLIHQGDVQAAATKSYN